MSSSASAANASFENVDEAMAEFSLFSKRSRPSDTAQVYRFAFRFSFSMKNYEGKTEAEALAHFKKEWAQLKVALAKAKYIFQLECTVHEGRDNWHYQGYIKAPEKSRPATLGKVLGQLFPGIWVAACSTAGDEALKKYCMKKDETYREGPWADKPIAPEYDGKEFDRLMPPWHHTIINRLPTKPHSRRIYWILDQGGGVMKSSLVKYIGYKKLGVKLSFDTAANLLALVVEMGAQPAYFFDLPRTKGKGSHMEDIYQALENIKDGYVVTGKYRGGVLIMPTPHVFVFSNYQPNEACLSKGRLRVLQIDKEFMQFTTSLDPHGDEDKGLTWVGHPDHPRDANGNRRPTSNQGPAPEGPKGPGPEGPPPPEGGAQRRAEGSAEGAAATPPLSEGDGGYSAWGV